MASSNDNDDTNTAVPLRHLSPRSMESIRPSPAREALQLHLDADAHAPLKKRKSWFGSVRDAFHKGALSAKAAVDSMRGDKEDGEGRRAMMETQVGDEVQQQRSLVEGGKSLYRSSITPEPRDSLDSAASTTPLKSHTFSPQLGRRRTFSPREAVSSLRNHLPGHGSRSKRVSVYSIVGRTSTDAPSIAGPEQLLDGNDAAERHGRKNSVASSLVGSIRGLARRPTKGKATMSVETVVPASEATPLDPADEVPLPSSPINIPSAAPVLGLDLGISGMNILPSDMPGGCETAFRDEDTRKLRDPANFGLDGADGRKSSSLPLVPDEVKRQFTHPAIRQKPVTPGEVLLKLPRENLRPSPPPEPPATPLPGTNLPLDLEDAADDSASSGGKSQVFERSVTPTTQRDRKELRKLCSLDAIADACSAGRKDSAASSSASCGPVREEGEQMVAKEFCLQRIEVGLSSRWGGQRDVRELAHLKCVPSTTEDNDAAGMKASNDETNPFASHGSIQSASTASTCPSDMPRLERQGSADSKAYRFGGGTVPGSVLSTAPVFEDPFDDKHGTDRGPPSPTRSVLIPLRLKVKGPSNESGGSVEQQLLPSPVPDEEEDLAGNQYTFQTPPKWEGAGDQDMEDTQQHDLQHNHAVLQDFSNIEQQPVEPQTPEQTDILSDDTLSRAQSLHDSHAVYAQYKNYSMNSDEESEGGTSPHGGPIVPAWAWEREPSPDSASKSTWKAGLGTDGFKFSIDNWRPGPHPIPDPQPQLTPGRRTMDASIDCVSVDESFETPLGSRASTKSGRTPSMGNKLELDARRSERNLRYNALYQQADQPEQKQKSSSPVRMHARFVFGGSFGDMDPDETQYFPGYGKAPGTPEKSGGRAARVSSEESVTESLRSASDTAERLAAMLGSEIEPDAERESDVEPIDAFTTASSPRSKRPVSRRPRDVRSDSPTPETSASRKLPATPVIAPLRSSPAHRVAQENFSILDLEVDLISSPASDKTETADLPVAVGHDNRVGSGDTLDRTLDLLSSPDSGYKPDDSSDVQTSSPPSAAKQLPKRYRIQSTRKGGKVLGEISGNRG